MPAVLPFETGFLSTMSDRELLDVADELERSNYWRNEEVVSRIVDDYITRWWRQPAAGSAPMSIPTMMPTYTALRDSPYMSEARTRDILVRVPDALDERTTRLFVEIQVREQLNPRFDPTED